MKRNILLSLGILAILGITSCNRNETTNFPKDLGEQVIRAHIDFLSDDLLMGRAPGTTGSRIAQEYIVSQMQKAGLQPGVGDTSFFQSFGMVKINTDPNVMLEISAPGSTIRPDYYEDFMAFPGVHEEVIADSQTELVFVGYGIQADEYGWDDFKTTDVRDKILLIMNNDPDTGDPDFFGGNARLYYGRWDYKYEQAARMGAKGAIIIHTDESAGYPWNVVQTGWSGSQYELPPEQGNHLLYKGWITEELAYEIAGSAGFDLNELRTLAEDTDFEPVPMGVNINVSMQSTYDIVQGSNIVGVLPGVGSETAGQAVAFTAHYDHLGTGSSLDGDSIYNGALDNASGVASILMMAEAYQVQQISPQRSMVFIATDGEESGLLGSLYYSLNPTFPAEDIACVINMDGINFWGPTRDIVLIGYGKSSLDEIVERHAESQDRIVLGDLNPEQGSFYRSDQFSFAKVGIPGLYMDTGQDFIGKPEGWGRDIQAQWIDEKYHQPSDEYDPAWDFSGHMQDMELIFNVATDIANDPQMPSWLPGDEFAGLR